MMKRIFLAATMSAALVTAQAQAGGMAEPMMEPEVIVEEAAASSGGFVVPLILLALVALALANNNDDDSDPFADASDVRLKTDVVQVGMTDIGLPLYHFRYLDTGPVFEGVMAQDVLQQYPNAIVPMPGGYMAVDYGMLGLGMRKVQ